MNDTYCFYHSADHDGIMSAAIVRYYIPSAILIPVDYVDDDINEKLSTISFDDTVFMVDFSIRPIKKMIKLEKMCKLFIWIDHHSDIISDAIKIDFNPKGIRDSSESACQLTWKFFNKNIDVPFGISIINEYDLGRHNSRIVMVFHYGIDAYPLDPTLQIWTNIIEDYKESINSLIINGSVIYNYKIKEMLRDAEQKIFEVDFGGYKALAINSWIDFNFINKFGYFDSSKYHFLIMFYRLKNIWKFSLRTNRKDVNLSTICGRFGGGGHPEASGFETKDDKFIERMIKGKTIIVNE